MTYTPEQLRAIAERVHHAEAGAALVWASDALVKLERERDTAQREQKRHYRTIVEAAKQMDQMRAELAAARAVVEAARKIGGGSIVFDRLIAAYDEVTRRAGSARSD